MAVLNRRDYYAAIPQLEGRLSKLSKYITVEEGKLQIKIDDLYGNVATLTQTAESIESRVEGIEDGYVTSTVLTQTKNALTLEINEKAQVFTSQPTTPYYVGDLWTQGPNGEIYRCKTNRLSGNYTASDWEKASDYTDDTTANAEANNRTMLVRAFNGGVITAYVGNTYGVYTNASGSVDIVELSWSGNTPSIDDTLASYGTETRIGNTSGPNMRISSDGQLMYYGNTRLFRMRPDYYSSSASAVYMDFGTPLSQYTSRIYGGSGLLTLSASHGLTLGGSSVSITYGLTVGSSISASGSISGGAISGSSLSISGNATVNKLYINTPGTASSSTANTRIATGESNRVMFTGSSSRKVKHDIKPIEDDILDPHRLYDAEVVQFVYNLDYLNKKDNRYGMAIPGFIADDLQKVYPIAVDIENGEPQDWNFRYVLPPMLALIQEQHKEIEELKRRIECLNESKK